MRNQTTKVIEKECINLWSNFIVQVEEALDALSLKRSDLAEKVEVTKGRVSQIMNTPGNLTLLSMVRLGSAVGKKIKITLSD